MKYYSSLFPEESVTRFRNDFGLNFFAQLLNPKLKTFRCKGKKIKTSKGYITFTLNGKSFTTTPLTPESQHVQRLGMYLLKNYSIDMEYLNYFPITLIKSSLCKL